MFLNTAFLRASLQLSAFLDPTSYQYLSCSDKEKAEAIICNEAEQHYEKFNSQSLSSSSQLLRSTLSNKNQQNSQAKILHNFFITCGLAQQSASICFKPSTIKEEIVQYIAND